MTKDEVEKYIVSMKPDDQTAVNLIVNEIMLDASKLVDKVVEMLSNADVSVVLKAQDILEKLGVIGLDAVTGKVNLQAIENSLWYMQAISDMYSENTVNVATEFEKLMKDTREIPQQKPDSVEEEPARKRICDDAFILARNIFHHKEDEETKVDFELEYYNLTYDERDQVIRQYLTKGDWSNLVTDLVEDEI